jgi:hypothetical protein
MSLLKAFGSAYVLALAAPCSFVPASAQTPAPAPAVAPAAPAAGAKLVLLPYEETGSTDPHAAAITQTLASEFAAAASP